MNREELRNLRKARGDEIRQAATRSVRILVGMGSCGIAAGAMQTLDALLAELESQGVRGVAIGRTGCMGLCHAEPTAEVIMPGMPDTIYGNVDPKIAREIVRRHIVAGSLVDGHVYDRPAADIVGRGR